MSALDILKKYWGFDSFRSQQTDIVESAVAGRDTFALLPTGGGKSICFQVPGMVRDGICIVVSPLIALMQDQVKGLKDRGINAAAITSDMTRREIDITLDNAKYGDMKFLYVSPERLKTEIFITRFSQMNVGLIAIDEAHCISQWGHDFRPPYLEIYKLREIHPNVPMIAVTATATEQVKEDIIEFLKLKDVQYFEGNFARENISYEVYHVKNKRNGILKACQKFAGLSGIIYCQTRRSTKEVAKLLLAHNFSAGIYHGGLTGKERKEKLDAWLGNRIKIMIATNAFGMGIDKPDVRFVLHYEVPDNIEAYFQEAGRAGRDGKNSRNMAFYTGVDLVSMQQRVEKQFPPIDFIKIVYRALCNHLNIAIGSGENESYSLNIREFIKKYDFDLIETYNALKILELNNSILLNEATFHPTKLKFIVQNKTLYDFQIKNERFDNLISLLSRSFSGIFDFHREISEEQIAKRLNIPIEKLIKDLGTLESQGLADINWRSNLPQVTLLHERLPDDYMTINPSIYKTRKDVAFEKLSKMQEFLQKPECRSILLLRYFGQKGDKCGKCDICLAEEKSNHSIKELRVIIADLLDEKKYSILELQNVIKNTSPQLIENIAIWMLDEGIVVIENGKLRKV